MPTQSLSPSLLNVMIEQAAAGRIRPSTLVSNIQANNQYSYKDASGKFSKVRPGLYRVELGDKVEEVESATTAKMLILETLVDAARTH